MKAGDYVRTKDYLGNQLINKIKKVYDDETIHTDKGYWDNEHIIKTSQNIIDLIEVGDYVNGYLVYEIKENCVMVGYKCFKTEFDNEEDFLYQTIYANDIKSIVTKERFEDMEYKIC